MFLVYVIKVRDRGFKVAKDRAHSVQWVPAAAAVGRHGHVPSWVPASSDDADAIGLAMPSGVNPLCFARWTRRRHAAAEAMATGTGS